MPPDFLTLISDHYCTVDGITHKLHSPEGLMSKLSPEILSMAHPYDQVHVEKEGIAICIPARGKSFSSADTFILSFFHNRRQVLQVRVSHRDVKWP